MKTLWLFVVFTTLCVNIEAAEKSHRELQNDFYHPDKVQSIHLQITDKDRQRMLAALPKRIYVPATFRWQGISIKKVAVRFKGNSSSNPNQKHKRSYLIKFDKYDKEDRFLGLRRVSFDNGIQFGSLFSEPIVTEILREHGLTTYRCNYAKIYLNDKYQGVYVNVERIDETFVEKYLPGKNGALYKADEGGPGSNLQFIGEDPSLYKKAFEAKNETAKKQRERLVEFIRFINESEKDDFSTQLEARLELNDFLRTTAIMLYSGAFDQLTGGSAHNYYLHHDTSRDRWRYLSWDLDVGFSETAFGRLQVLADWNAAWPIPLGDMPSPLLERIVDDPEMLQRYRQMARTILDQSFEPDRLCKIVDKKYALIKEDLQTDPFPHQRITNPKEQSYDEIVESIKVFIRKRYASADQQLKNPGPKPKIVRRQPGERRGNLPPGFPPQLAAKFSRMKMLAEQMQRKGQDISPIHKLMQNLGPLVQQGKIEEADKLLDEALKFLGHKPNEIDKNSSPK